MADPTAKKKRLPKELQVYKRNVKQLSFEQKVREYFNLSPYQRDIDSIKKDIVYEAFSRIEKEEFARKYQPIYWAIDRYADRIRAIYNNTFLYSFYVTSELRKKDILSYTADFLNNLVSFTEESLSKSEDEKVKKALEKNLKRIKSYKVPEITTAMMTKGKEGYGINNEEIDKELLKIVEKLKGFLAMLKCYLESLREFMEWVGTPELFPKEFAEMERGLMIKYVAVSFDGNKNPQEEEYPLYFHRGKATEELVSIDYMKLPRTINIFGERNLFVRRYRSFFNY